MYLLEHGYFLNIVILLSLIYVSFRIDSLVCHLTLIFIYISLHYSYGMLPIFYNSDTAFNFYKFLRENTNIAFQLIGLLGLFVLFLIPYFKLNLKQILNLKDFFSYLPVKILLYLSLLWLASIFSLHSSLNLESKLVVKLLLMQGLTLGCIYVASYMCICANRLGIQPREVLKTAQIIFSTVLIMTAIAIVELYLRKTWVCCTWVRPSALLFNPNNLALWYLFAGAVLTVMYMHGISSMMSAIGLLMTAFGIFITGSRSIFIVYLFLNLTMVLTSAMLGRGYFKRSFHALILCVLSFGLFCILPHLLNTILPENNLISDLQKNSIRFILAAPFIYQFLFHGVSVSFSETYLFKHILSQHTAPLSGVNLADSGMVNLVGRLSSTSTDNAYIYLYGSMPKLIVIFWAAIILLPFIMSLKYVNLRKNIILSQLLVVYVAILISGLSINIFMVFPNWIMLAGIFGAIIAFCYKQQALET